MYSRVNLKEKVKNKIVRNLLLAVISSILLIAAWPPSELNFLLFIAFVPILILVYEQKKTIHGFLWFYMSFQLFITGMHIPMLSNGEHLLPILFGILIVPIFWSIPIALSMLVKKKMGLSFAMILFPLFFVCQEVAQYYWDFSVTWFHLGLGLSNSPYAMGIYPFFGQEGGTVLILAANLSVYVIYIAWQQKSLKGAHFTPIGITILVVVIFNLVDLNAHKPFSVDVAVFQPDKAQMESNKNNLNAQIDLLENSLKDVHFKGADLLICSESYLADMIKHPLVVNYLESHDAVKRLSGLSIKYKTPILSGATFVELFASDTPPTLSAKEKEPGVYYDIYNGSIFITPDAKLSWRSKQTLVPFAEVIPFYKVFNMLEGIGLWPNRYDKTYASASFQGAYIYNRIRIAPAICFESLFPNVLASYVQKKANLMVIMSSKWTSAERLLEQQQDGMSINVRSFGMPLIYATTDLESSITTKKEQKKFSNSVLDVKSIQLTDTSSFYSKYASQQWHWFIITGLFIFVLWILDSKKMHVIPTVNRY